MLLGKKTKKVFLFILIGVMITILFSWLGFYLYKDNEIITYTSKNKHFEIIYYNDKIIPEYVISTIEKIDGQADKYEVYLASEKGCKIPRISNSDNKKILWLGMSCNFAKNYIKQALKVDYVFIPYEKDALNQREFEINAYVVPLLYAKTKYEMSPKYFAVIGDFPKVEKELKKQKLKYKKYADYEEAYKDFSHIKAVFAQNSSISFQESKYYLARFINSLSEHLAKFIGADKFLGKKEPHPFLLEAAYNKIPIFLDVENDQDGMKFLGYNVSYLYPYDKLEDVLNNILDNSKNVTSKVDEAYNIVSRYYLQDKIVKDIKNILSGAKIPQNETYDYDLSVKIMCRIWWGNCGEYWLAKYLKDFAEKFDYRVQIIPDDATRYYSSDKFVNFAVKTEDKPILGRHNYFYYIYNRSTEIENADIEDISQLYDEVMVSSYKIYDKYKNILKNMYFVPQFTNTNIMYNDYDAGEKSEVFFAGSHHFDRIAAKTIYEAGLPIDVYGNNWDNILPVKGNFIDNKILRKYYSSAKIVLNDTLEGMKANGFISNRIYDVSACGTMVISDYMPEIERIYGDSVPMYRTKEELINLVKYYLKPENEKERIEKAQKAQKITLEHFTQDKVFAEMFKIMQLNNENK